MLKMIKIRIHVNHFSILLQYFELQINEIIKYPEGIALNMRTVNRGPAAKITHTSAAPALKYGKGGKNNV